jgi:transcriptional regulator
MFRPAYTRVEDPARILAFVRDYPFGILVSEAEDGAPFGTHIPFLVRQAGAGGLELAGHVAKANPHWRLWNGERESLVIFSGPHGYVSPSWYGEHPSVPTWNYAAVHAYGRPRALTGQEELWALVAAQIDAYEVGREAPWRPGLPPDYRDRMLAGIVGLVMPVSRWEAKFKLSQNRSIEDRERVTARLETSPYPGDRELGRFMRVQADIVFPERQARPREGAPTARRDSITDLD